MFVSVFSGILPFGAGGICYFLFNHFPNSQQNEKKIYSCQNNSYIVYIYQHINISHGLPLCRRYFYKINKQKFPPKLPYIIWSSLSIVTLFVLHNRLKINKYYFVNYIGKNAIFYYFSQGISSSFIYFIIIPLLGTTHWTLLLAIIFTINILLSIGIAEILKRVDDLGWKILYYLKNKTLGL